MTNLKAKKAVITLGDIELDCYQMPDGQYGYGYQWLSDYLGIDKQLLSNKKSPFYLYEHLKSIDKAGLSCRSVLVEGISNSKLNWLNTAELMEVLASLVKISPKVLDLVVACAIESLERRADSVFGVQRSDEERDQFLKIRAEGILDRRSLTDSIKDYIIANDCSEDYTKWIYSNVSKCLNDRVYDASTKEIRLVLDLKPSALIRDFVPKKALAQIAFTERMAMVMIDEDGFEPLEAMKQAIKVCHTKTIGIK